MKNLPLYIMITISIVLAGIYFYEVHVEKLAREARLKSGLLFPGLKQEPDTILITSHGMHIEIRRELRDGKGFYVITSPIRTNADQRAVNTLITIFRKLRYERLIREEVDDPSLFGLDKPAVSITLSSPERHLTLYIGDKTPIEDGYYVMRKGDRSVFLISTHLGNLLQMGLYELRNKKIFSLEFHEIDELVITNPHEEWVFSKGPHGWNLKEDSGFKVDTEKINHLLRQLLNEDAASFEGRISEGLEDYGLSSPRLSIRISTEKKREELLIGDYREVDSKRYFYALLKKKGELITIDESFVDLIPIRREAFKKFD